MQGMRKLPFFLLAALAVAPLSGQSLQQQADSMTLTPPAPGARQLEIPTIPGAEVKLLGCDYEQLIDKHGRIISVREAVPVRVCFTVTKDGEQVTSRDYEFSIRPDSPRAGGNAKPAVIPELLQWQGGEGSYTLGDSIVAGGATGVAKELAADIEALFDQEMTVLDSGKASIYLHRTSPCEGMGDEEYRLDIRPDSVHLYARTDKALYWGTRSLLQMLRQGNRTAPCGTAVDMPRYAVRSFMLDVGRLPMPPADLRNIIHTLAWYKMNELQLHLNDNYIFHEKYVDAGEDPFKRSYSAFRLESDVKGADGTPLTAQDLAYSKQEFRALVNYAKRHGITIVPEFDTPGHALSFTRVRPDLIYQGPMNKPKRRCEMLDASKPEALQFAASVWDEFLGKGTTRDANKGATFGNCPIVHVGADEFYGDKEDYRAFADGILRHALSRGYTPRIWGSLRAKPGKTPVLARGVQMNMWSKDWAHAWESIAQGYDIINTDDSKLYIVPYADYYRMDKRHQWVYENWQVNNIHGQIIPSGHPQLLGGMFAIWQDMCDQLHNGYMCYDYWPAVTGSIDVLSQKMWGQPKTPRSFAEHRELVKAIGPAPRTDALRREGAADKALDLKPGKLPAQPGRGSLGPAYHLTMELTLNEAPEGEEQVLLDSREGQLLAVGPGGCVGFRRADSMLFSFAGAKLPVGEHVTLELIGKPGSTELKINGQPAGTLTLVTHHGRTEKLVATFILPLERVGKSFHGKVHRLKVEPR